jgi:hypothetical protein
MTHPTPEEDRAPERTAGFLAAIRELKEGTYIGTQQAWNIIRAYESIETTPIRRANQINEAANLTEKDYRATPERLCGLLTILDETLIEIRGKGIVPFFGPKDQKPWEKAPDKFTLADYWTSHNGGVSNGAAWLWNNRDKEGCDPALKDEQISSMFAGFFRKVRGSLSYSNSGVTNLMTSSLLHHLYEMEPRFVNSKEADEPEPQRFIDPALVYDTISNWFHKTETGGELAGLDEDIAPELQSLARSNGHLLETNHYLEQKSQEKGMAAMQEAGIHETIARLFNDRYDQRLEYRRQVACTVIEIYRLGERAYGRDFQQAPVTYDELVSALDKRVSSRQRISARHEELGAPDILKENDKKILDAERYMRLVVGGDKRFVEDFLAN